MAERLMGIETEYAVAGVDRKGGGVDPHLLVERLMTAAQSGLRYLPDLNSSGIFLANGSRFYIDCGSHPELATPECADPWEAVRYVQAGERILASLAGHAEASLAGVQVLVFRSNMDYADPHVTWGCHESYLHRGDPAVMPEQIIPHLVSRVIYTGAGGFNPFSAGLHFVISPRALHLGQATSADSTGNRGIYHEKDEPLCEGYRRMHVLCGESLCSELAVWLKVGTTALVVAMIEAGLRPGDGVQLVAPVPALRKIAGDPTCKALVQLTGGRAWSALEIQRHYLEQAEANTGRDFMPPWTAEVCRHWRAILDRLENAPDSVATSLDWAVKHALFIDRARRRGFRWESLREWNSAMERLRFALDHNGYAGSTVTVDFLNAAQAPLYDELARLKLALQKKGLDWKDLKRFLALRRESFEIDMRFGQLWPKGVFDALDSRGVLNHRVAGIGDVERAVTEPPGASRARLRGELVRRYAGPSTRYSCDWQSVWDFGGRRVLELANPFETAERWQSFDEQAEDESIEDRRQRLLRWLRARRGRQAVGLS